MKAPNLGGVGRNHDSERIWLHCVAVCAVNVTTCQVLSIRRTIILQVVILRWY